MVTGLDANTTHPACGRRDSNADLPGNASRSALNDGIARRGPAPSPTPLKMGPHPRHDWQYAAASKQAAQKRCSSSMAPLQPPSLSQDRSQPWEPARLLPMMR